MRRSSGLLLLFVVDDDVVDIASLGVLALKCRGPRFSVLRNRRSYGHCDLSGFFRSGLNRVGIYALH